MLREISLLLKSITTPSADIASDTRSPYVVLCSRDKTFQFRQIQTSNTVFLTQTLGEDGCSSLGRHTAISAFSTCDAVLELAPSNEDAASYLRSVLLPYDGMELRSYHDAKHPRTKKDIIADIPISDHECNQAWISINAFELGENCYIPLPQILIQLWSSMLSTAIAEDIDLTGTFHAEDLWTHMDHELYPRPLLAGLLDKLCSSSGDISWDSRKHHICYYYITC